jgi:hypothetical protein
MRAPQRTKHAAAASPTLPDPRFAGSLGRRFRAPHFKELQRSHVPQKTCNSPRSELTKKINVGRRKKSLYITVINRKMSGQLPDLGLKFTAQTLYLKTRYFCGANLSNF